MKPCDNCKKLTSNCYDGFYFCDECVYPMFENKVAEARRFAFTSQKYGNQIDPDMMSNKELLTWYNQCLTYDAE